MIGENNQITTYRMTLDAENKEVYSVTPTLTNEPCYIEPLDAQVSTVLDSVNAFFMFKIFLEGTLDILVGDKCVDQQSKEYIVKGVEKYSNNPDTGDVTELTCVSRFPSA